MAPVGAGSLLLHGCLGFIWRAGCKPYLPADLDSDIHACIDGAPQCDTGAVRYAYRPTYINLHTGWNADPFADCYSYAFANAHTQVHRDITFHRNAIQDRNSYIYFDCDAYENPLANRKFECAGNSRSKHSAVSTGNRRVVAYAHPDEDCYAGSCS